MMFLSETVLIVDCVCKTGECSLRYWYVQYCVSCLKGVYLLRFPLVAELHLRAPTWHVFCPANNLGVPGCHVVLWEARRQELCSCVLVLTLTIGGRGCRGVGRGSRSRGRGLGRGWSLIVIRCTEDVHATGWTGLLPLEPGAQAAVGRKGWQQNYLIVREQV